MHAYMYNINIVRSTVLYCYCVHIVTAVSVGYIHACAIKIIIVLAIISYIHDTQPPYQMWIVEANHTIIFLVTSFTL